MARGFTKLSLRQKAMKRLEDQREDDLQTFVNAVNSPAVQKGLEIYIQSLKKK